MWASQMRHARSALITSLRREPLFRSLMELQVRVRPRESAPEALARAQGPHALSAATRSLLQQTAAATSDLSLRAALLRLAETRMTGTQRP